MQISMFRASIAITAMLLVVAAGFVAIVGFFAIGTSISNLTISNGTPSCPGTTLTGQRRAMALDPEMHCTMPVTIRNDGRLAVTLDEMVLPFMGSEGGAAVQVSSWDGRATPDGDIDAAFDVDHRLEPGRTWDTEIEFTFRPGGCTARGTLSVGLPVFRAGAWGRSVQVRGPDVLFGGTRESSC